MEEPVEPPDPIEVQRTIAERQKEVNRKKEVDWIQAVVSPFVKKTQNKEPKLDD